MEDVEGGAGNELARALNRRRKVVDRRGLQFTKDPAETSRVADVTWEEQHESQFTPRSRHQRVAAALAEDVGASAVAVPVAARPEVAEAALALAPTPGPSLTSPPAPSAAAKPMPPATCVAAPLEPRAAAGGAAAHEGHRREEMASSGDAAGGTPLPVSSAAGARMPPRLLRSGLVGEAAPTSAEEPQAAPASPSAASSTSTASTVRLDDFEQAATSMGVAPPSVAASSPVLPPPESPLFAGVPATPRGLAGGMQSLGRSNALIWHAVVEGDVRRIEELTARGLLVSGRLLDHNGHSIFWNALAFQQPEVALWLLHRFPPGSDLEASVDLSEVHARRRDSLLHLCLYFSDFSPAAAEVFRCIFRGGVYPWAPRELANQHGQTFVHIAAARLNFWVLHFVLSNAPETAALFQHKDAAGDTPLDVLLRRVREVGGAPVAQPAPQLPPPEARLPAWTRLASCLGKPGAAAAPPFADLVLEVEDRGAPGGVARLWAHRVVVAANSAVLHAQIRRLLPGKPLRLDPHCCKSSEVVKVLLGYLYSGELACTFSKDAFLLWQLLCLCTHYRLPAPLAFFTRAALVHSLGTPRHAPVVPALLQAADNVGLTPEEAFFTACIFLGSPQAAQAVDSEGKGTERHSQALLAALAKVESWMLGSGAALGPPRPLHHLVNPAGPTLADAEYHRCASMGLARTPRAYQPRGGQLPAPPPAAPPTTPAMEMREIMQGPIVV